MIAQLNLVEIVEKSLRERIKLLIKKGYSQEKIAGAIGKSGTTLSQWLHDKYECDNSTLEKALLAYANREEEKVNFNIRKIKFSYTSVAKKMLSSIARCHRNCEMAAIYGAAGVGKTTALKEYVSRNPGTILLQADYACSKKELFRELHIAIGFDGVGSYNALKEDIKFKLYGSGRLIIVDEAENMTVVALECARRLHDLSDNGFGLLFVGMPKLQKKLMGHKGTFDQLYTRLAQKVEVNYMTRDDAMEMLRVNLPGHEDLCDQLYELSNTRLRTFAQIINNAMQISQSEETEITRAVIARAANMIIVG